MSLNPILDQSTLEAAPEIQQNLYPTIQQTDPSQYLQLAAQLQKAQMAQRDQRQALDGGRVQFQNEQQRQDFFKSRDLQDQQVSQLERQFATIPKPTTGQLNPVDLSQHPLTADPMSQFARLQKVGGLDVVLNPEQARFAKQRLDDMVAARTGIDKTAMDKWQSSKVNAISGDQLIANPRFIALHQTDKAKADQIFEAATGQKFDAYAQHAAIQKQKLADIGQNLIKEKVATNDFLNLPDGTVVMAQIDPMTKQRIWTSPSGDDKNSGNTPDKPKKMAAATHQALLYGADALGMSVRQLGIAAQSQPAAQVPQADSRYNPAQTGDRPSPSNMLPMQLNTGQVNPGFNPRIVGGKVPVMANSNLYPAAGHEINRTLGILGENWIDMTYNPMRQAQILQAGGDMARHAVKNAAIVPLAVAIQAKAALSNLLNPEAAQQTSTSLTPEQLAILQNRKH